MSDPDGDRGAPRAGTGPPHAVRLFVALDLPGAARDTLAALGAAADPERWRPLPREALHVTLAFLGHRPAADVDLIRPVIASGPAPALALGRGRLLGRGRALTVELADPTGALAALQAQLSGELAALGVYTPERRAFRAHVTVARLRPRADPPRRAEIVVEPLAFHGEALTLYRSKLHPSGARYEPLAIAPLSAA